MARKTPKSRKSGVQVQNSQFDLIRLVCGKELFNSPCLANKTPKSLKDSVHVQNGPLDLIRPVCEKELFQPEELNAPFALIRPLCEKNLFCHNWPEDSDKQKQPCSGAGWPIRLIWPSLWETGNSPHLVTKSTKTSKSRFQV